MRVLASYHYFKTVDMEQLVSRFPVPPDVFCDSGAFSAFTQGAVITVEEYARFVERWGHLFAAVANLDVIGDTAEAAAASMVNLRALEERGIAALPVFHAGEPWSALERLLDEGYTYIALGGMVGRKLNVLMPWLVRCFRLAEGRAVYHGFGLTSWRALADLPWYSVDSSSWGSSFRYGQLRLWDERQARFVIVALSDHRSVYGGDGARLIREHGYDPVTFADKASYTREAACGISAVAWWRAEQHLRRRHGEISVPSSVRPSGLRWYCADASGQNLADGGVGLNLYLSVGGSIGDIHHIATAVRQPEEVA